MWKNVIISSDKNVDNYKYINISILEIYQCIFWKKFQ